ncbi:hypothetical protein BKA82DRAFT_4098577 [Pisolithus tinctorius]|nr:hypothetical protein BKA82DRAFT_4098577 [Pisolithus tinctorius]
MASAADPEVIINEFADSIRPALSLIIANTAFSASLLTLFVVLLALSTKESRRRMIFRLNVFAICVALTMGVLVGFCNGKIVVDQLDQVSTSLAIATMVFTFFPPLLWDSILLTRLFALYPISSTPPATLLKILAFPLSVKCGRVVVLTIVITKYVRSVTAEGPILAESTDWTRDPYLIAEWVMQIADNMYSVSLFLYNLHVRTGWIKPVGGISTRIRQIFYISAANFVFPVIFNIVLIISVAIDLPVTTGGLLWLINDYVTVMGLLFATVWFSGSEWVQTRNIDLRRVDDTGRKRRSEIVVVGKGFATPDTSDLDAGPVTDCKPLGILTGEDKYCTV